MRSSLHQGRRFIALAPAAVLGIALALGACAASPSSARRISSPSPRSSDSSTTFTQIRSALERGGATLCPINHITPNNQGGNAVIDIFTFGSNGRCDITSTAHQGILYIAQEPARADASYFLFLAGHNPAFQTGWLIGRVAIAVGGGVAPQWFRAVVTALSGQADLVFG